MSWGCFFVTRKAQGGSTDQHERLSPDQLHGPSTMIRSLSLRPVLAAEYSERDRERRVLPQKTAFSCRRGRGAGRLRRLCHFLGGSRAGKPEIGCTKAVLLFAPYSNPAVGCTRVPTGLGSSPFQGSIPRSYTQRHGPWSRILPK